MESAPNTKRGNCHVCGKIDVLISYGSGNEACCEHCDFSDADMWEAIKIDRREKRHKNIQRMDDNILKLDLENLIVYVNNGTICFNNQYYYYAQKKEIRPKGTKRYYGTFTSKQAIEIFKKISEGVSFDQSVKLLEQELDKKRHKRLKCTMPFGKHKGQPLYDIPIDYLKWIYKELSNNCNDNFMIDGKNWLANSIFYELEYREKISRRIDGYIKKKKKINKEL